MTRVREFTRVHLDGKLAKILFNEANQGLRRDFEKATKTTLSHVCAATLIEAKTKKAAIAAEKALDDMSAALDKIPMRKLKSIVKALG